MVAYLLTLEGLPELSLFQSWQKLHSSVSAPGKRQALVVYILT